MAERGLRRSYNIDTWKTKRLEGLIIPLGSLYKHEKKDRHPSAPSPPDEHGRVKLRWSSGSYLVGTMRDVKLSVSDISIQGDWSSYIYFDCLLPALQDSTGELEAVTVWAGGDAISRLTVKDGKVKQENVNP